MRCLITSICISCILLCVACGPPQRTASPIGVAAIGITPSDVTVVDGMCNVELTLTNTLGNLVLLLSLEASTSLPMPEQLLILDSSELSEVFETLTATIGSVLTGNISVPANSIILSEGGEIGLLIQGQALNGGSRFFTGTFNCQP